MQVTLLNYTIDAELLLVFTKNTRLGLNKKRIRNLSLNDRRNKMIQNELAYMANTIPSSWEFVDYTFLIEGVSRAFTHQFVRNRTGSYAQESLRVTDKCDYDFVMPNSIAENESATAVVDELNEKIKDAYSYLTKGRGIPTEDARSILPINIATNIVAKFNLRTMSELAKSRMGGRTQKEYQNVMHAMIDEVTKVHPWAEMFLFGDVGRDYFQEIEEFAAKEWSNDLLKKGELLKIVDKMRKAK